MITVRSKQNGGQVKFETWVGMMERIGGTYDNYVNGVGRQWNIQTRQVRRIWKMFNQM